MSKDTQLPTKEREMLLQLFTKRGLMTDINISNERFRESQQKKQLVAYHNPEFLLKHYKIIAQLESVLKTH